MSRRRCLWSFQAASEKGTSALAPAAAAHPNLSRRTRRQTDILSGLERSLPGSISRSTQPNAQMSRLSTGYLRLLGTHDAAVQDDARLVSLGVVMVGVTSDGIPVAGPAPSPSEIEHLDSSLGRDLDIGRLEIPVNHPFLMRGFEGFGNLPGQLQGFFDRNRAALETLRQRAAFDELEHEKARAFVRFESMNRRDVGMVQRGQ